MNHYQRSVLGTLLILVIALCSGFLVNRWFSRIGRIDTTSAGLYTLTEGTRNILGDLQVPLTAKLYYSKTLVDDTGVDQYRSLNNFFYYVRDLLRTYEEVSDGKLKLQVFDPIAFSDAEEEADRLGVRRFPTPAENGFYFGLAITSDKGEQEVLEFLDPQRQSQIEYLVSEAVERVVSPERARIGVLSSLDVLGGNLSPMERQMRQMQGQPIPQSWQSIELLRRLYEVEEVAADATEIDAELDYLLIVHPKGLGDDTLYAIDQFVMRGGKLICFVDPFAGVADPAPRDPQNPFGGAQNHDASSNLSKLFESWGVKVESQKFVGDFDLGQQMRSQRGPVVMGGYLGLNTKGADGVVRGVNTDDVITQGMTAPLQLYFAGVIQEQSGAASGVELRPLLMAGENGRTFTATAFDLAPPMGAPDPQAINKKIDEGEPAKNAVIAARLIGKLKSAFPEGSPSKPAADDAGDDAEDPAEGEDGGDEGEAAADEGGDATTEDATDDAPAHLAECAEVNQVVIAADVDMLTDALALQRSLFGAAPGGGCEFLLNSVDALAGSTDLLSIRSRGSFERPFTVVNEIERAADARLREQVQKINKEIEGFDQQLSSLRSQANEENVALLQNEAIEKKRELETKKRDAQRDLNDVQRERNEEIDALESRLLFLNVVGVPGAVLLIGLLMWVVRLTSRLSVTGGVR